MHEQKLDLDTLLSSEPASKAIIPAPAKKPTLKPGKAAIVCLAALAAGILLGALTGFAATALSTHSARQEQRYFLLNDATIPYYEDTDGNILPADDPITLAQAEGITTQRLASLAVHTEGIADLYLAGKFAPSQYPVITTLADRSDAVIALDNWVQDSDWQVALIARFLQTYCESRRILQ